MQFRLIPPRILEKKGLNIQADEQQSHPLRALFSAFNVQNPKKNKKKKIL